MLAHLGTQKDDDFGPACGASLGLPNRFYVKSKHIIWKVCDFVDKIASCVLTLRFFQIQHLLQRVTDLHIQYLLELTPSNSGKERFSLGFLSLKSDFSHPASNDCILHGGVYQKYLHLDPMFHPHPPSRHTYPAGRYGAPPFPPGGRFLRHFVPPKRPMASLWLSMLGALFFWNHTKLRTRFFQAWLGCQIGGSYWGDLFPY